MSKLLDFAISYVLKLSFLNGYRSYIAGAGMMLCGVGMIANQVGSGVYDHDSMEKGIALIGAGLTVLGHAGKMDKLIEAAKEGKQ